MHIYEVRRVPPIAEVNDIIFIITITVVAVPEFSTCLNGCEMNTTCSPGEKYINIY